jgi:uncharacterized protein YgiM (DUF1202 family)
VRFPFSSVFLCMVLMSSPLSAMAQSIAKEEVNVRSGPGLESIVLLKAPLGYPIKIEKKKGEWIYFRDYVGNRYWVHKNLISDIQTVVIQEIKAVVRSGPGADTKVVAEAREGEIYRILGRKGKWIWVGYYHDSEPIGWIRNDLVFGE